jgi:hypothetical protein
VTVAIRSLALVVLLAAFSSIDPVTHLYQPSDELPPNKIGLKDPMTGKECEKKEVIIPLIDGPRCTSYPKNGKLPSGNDRKLTQWLESKVEWHGQGTRTLRRAVNGGLPVERTLYAVAEPGRYAFRDLGKRSLVIGKIVGDPNGPEDEYYHIGARNTRGWRPNFYIVAEDIRIPDTSSDPAYTVGSYRILGINARGEIEELRIKPAGVQQLLKFCFRRHEGSDREQGARFTTCRGMDRLHGATRADSVVKRVGLDSVLAVLRQSSSVGGLIPLSDSSATVVMQRQGLALSGSARVAIVRFLNDELTDPAWLVCAIGCCSVE